jgi:histone acetyltransferase 1
MNYPEQPTVSPYKFMGYCTTYRYYPIRPSTKRSTAEKRIRLHKAPRDNFPIPFTTAYEPEPSRIRISQFLILPPFQSGGHGARFYQAIYKHYVSDPSVFEITVEDPNEAFDDLRDLNDLLFLRSHEMLSKLRINADVQVSKRGRIPTSRILEPIIREGLRKSTKMAQRQFDRVLEMELLSRIPKNIRKSMMLEKAPLNTPETKRAQNEYRLWTLLVRQRLYKHNMDTLIQLDAPERIEKLEEAAGGVEMDYGRMLGKLERGLKKNGEQLAEGLKTVEESRKRAREEDEEVVEGDGEAKKAKTAEA